MTVGVKTLVDCVNASINSATTPLSLLQLSSVSRDIDSAVVSVACAAALPSAACNKGRLIYVQDVCGYRWSDGSVWTNNFTSTPENVTAWAWGYNNSGQLGDNTIINRSSPVSVVGGFTDWCQVSAGSAHNLGLRTNGALWAWGCNGVGRLGDGSTINRSSPVSVVGGFTDWCQVSGGGAHSLGVRTNGTAWAWGGNDSGQLGDNTVINRSSPVSVVGGFLDWCQISAGNIHSLGVRTDGTAWAWGRNDYGQLGDGTTIDKSSPVSVVGGFTDWCQVSTGSGSHSLGVRTNGTAWAWGCNFWGNLGNGCSGFDSSAHRSSPVSVVGGFTDWCQVSAGNSHSLGIRTNGTVWTWGRNNYGQLGDNSKTDRSSPVSVVGGFTNWCQVGAGSFHTFGVRTNGTAWAWGNSGAGRLGDGTTTLRSSPVSIVGGFTDWYQVSAGGFAHGISLRAGKGF